MELTVELREDVCIVHISDDITTDGIHAFSDFMKEQVLANHSRIILDMAEIDYFCSSAYGVMLRSLETARGNGGDLVLANVSESVYRLFEVTRLTSVVRLEHEMDGALRYFRKMQN